MAAYTSDPVELPSLEGVQRADLVFGGVEQAGPSFEGRVFLNNPGADETTALSPEHGYVGSFHVYGYGHPAPPGLRSAPIEKRLIADAGVVRAAAGDGPLRITVVPVPADPGGPVPERPFASVEVVLR
jgi:hypothetical protein